MQFAAPAASALQTSGCRPAARRSFVKLAPGTRRLLEELDQLRRRTTQERRPGFEIVFGAAQHVEGLGKKRGKVFVPRINVDPPGAAAALPQRAGNIGPLRVGADRLPDRQGQLEPQPLEGRAAVFALGSSLGRLCGQTRRSVRQDDSGLDLVAILTTRSAPSRGPEFTLAGEHLGIERGRMDGCRRLIVLLAGKVHEHHSLGRSVSPGGFRNRYLVPQAAQTYYHRGFQTKWNRRGLSVGWAPPTGASLGGRCPPYEKPPVRCARASAGLLRDSSFPSSDSRFRNRR